MWKKFWFPRAGRNYCANWAVTIAADLVAAQLVMGWWVLGHAGLILERAIFRASFSCRTISVRGFGEAEYWFSLIKVATVIIFIIVGVAMIIGIFLKVSSRFCWLQLDDGRCARWRFCGNDWRRDDRGFFP